MNFWLKFHFLFIDIDVVRLLLSTIVIIFFLVEGEGRWVEFGL